MFPSYHPLTLTLTPSPTQAEIADDYISDQFLVDNFGGVAGSGSADYGSIEVQ